MRRSCSRALAATLMLAFAPLPAAAGESFDTCKGYIDALPATITSPGTWCLRANLATSITAGWSIRIDTNNVTLDCNGFKLNGLGGGAQSNAVGIYGSDRINTTVRDCVVRGFRKGVSLWDSDASTVEDSTLENAGEVAIELIGDRAIIRRNRVVDTGGFATTHAFGISMNGEGEVLDNSVAGVVNPLAIGIYTNNNVGGVIAGNRVRDVASSNGGNAIGINLAGQVPTIVRDNALVGSGSTGIVCVSAAQLAMNNAVSGDYNVPIGSCTKSGNLIYSVP